MRNGCSLSLAEDHLQYGELHQHGYAHDDEGGYETVDAEVDAGREEDYMEQEVDGVAARKAEKAAKGGGGAESEDAGEVEVDGETDEVADSVCSTCSTVEHGRAKGMCQKKVDGKEQKKIHAVVDGGRYAAVDDETDELCLAGIAVLQS